MMDAFPSRQTKAERVNSCRNNLDLVLILQWRFWGTLDEPLTIYLTEDQHEDLLVSLGCIFCP